MARMIGEDRSMSSSTTPNRGNRCPQYFGFSVKEPENRLNENPSMQKFPAPASDKKREGIKI